MNIQKKLVTFILISVLLQSCNFFRKNKSEQLSVFKLIPTDASFLFVVKNFKNAVSDLTEKNLFYSNFQSLDAVKQFTQQIQLADSLSIIDEHFSMLLKNKIVFSYHLQGKETFAGLYIFTIPEHLKKERIASLIKKTFKQAEFSEREFSNTNIYKIEGKSESYHFYLQADYLVLSSSKILIEKSVLHSKTSYSIETESGFSKVRETAGKGVPINIYLNYSNLKNYVSHVLPNNHIISTLGTFADWSELDLNAKEDLLLLNGFTYASDSLNQFLSSFKNQKAIKFNFSKIVSHKINQIRSFAISDLDAFYAEYQKYLVYTKKEMAQKKALTDFQDKNGINPVDFFKAILDKEIVDLETDFSGLSPQQNQFALIKTYSQSITENTLKKYLSAHARKKGIATEQLSSKIQFDFETYFTVYTFPLENSLANIFGDFFNGKTFHYATLIDNYLVFSYDKTSIKSFLQEYITGKTLDKSANYKQFEYYLSDESCFFYYFNIHRQQNKLPTYFKTELKKALETDPGILENLHAFSIQLSPSKELFYTNIVLKYTNNLREDPQTIWETALDTIFKHKPYLVRNHYTNNTEVFIQDLNSNIYLINDVGRILWKVPIDGQIQSEVHQIDVFKNNKLQYLFNTTTKLYLVDRNGNNVDGFPISLRAEASNGLSVYDYDQSRNYRIFIAGKDKRIYLYDKHGKLVNGWKKPYTDHLVTTPVQHFREGSRDYIVFGDQLKTYIYNRKGEERVKVKEPVSKSANNTYFLDHNKGSKSGARIVTTNQEGKICYIYLRDGKVERSKISDFTDNHFFLMEDIDGDNKYEYIYVDKNKLLAFNYGQRKIIDFETPKSVTYKPATYRFSSTDIKIGIISEEENKIYLINNNGKLYKGFPLEGASQFSIGKFRNSGGKFNLLVGNSRNSIYNYKVE